MKNRLTLSFVLLLAVFISAWGQMLNPIHWETSISVDEYGMGVMTFKAKIDKGWHLYALDIPEGGPVATSLNWERTDGVELVGKPEADRKPYEQVDVVFNLKLGWWEDEVVVSQKFKVPNLAGGYYIEGYVRYMLCNDVTCRAPANEQFKFVKELSQSQQLPQPGTRVDDGTRSQKPEVTSFSGEELWAPVEIHNEGDMGGDSSASYSLWYIFFAGFIGGLLALLTPCVWPMIPLTVSFFLKKSGSRGKSVRDAMIYGLSIIVIYLALGLLITGIFGANSLNALSTNAIFNVIFFLLLVVFAISFFGAFEIRLPDSWANKMDSKAGSTSGMLSIFFMAFTLTLVSFSCTGPIIGTLLVEAASMGDKTGPAIGMLGFAVALAVPFMLFALFPSWLKGMPKSGGWLNTVKVVLGFIELALSLKFLSVADLAYGWGILDREVFVSLWVVIFGLLGIYLLGRLHLSGEAAPKGIGVLRLFLGIISLAFAVYLLPGLWGAPLKSVSAFVPPLYTQDFNLYGGGFTEYDDYEAGMRESAKQRKPVLVDFSGYGCVNCRKMEAAVLDDSEVRRLLEERFLMVKLMVDDKTDLPEPLIVKENDKEVKLRTVGDKWSYLQRYKFGANSQPYYVILNSDGSLAAGPVYYDEDVNRFVEFLNKGLNNYKK